jgi:hypothetical protein
MTLLPFSIPVFVWLGVRLAGRWEDGKRIGAHLQMNGCEAMRISRSSVSGLQRGERGYQVSFRNRQGQAVEGACAVSLLGGVRWTSHTLGFELVDEHGEPVPTNPEALEEESTCLTCGGVIPARKSRCPRCGWSYKDAG